MRKFFYNISSGNPKTLILPCVASFVDGLCKILPAAIVYIVFDTIYLFFAQPDTALDIGRLWITCIILAVWLIVQYMASAFAYSKTYDSAYASSALGRSALAEHLRKLPMGFFGKP